MAERCAFQVPIQVEPGDFDRMGHVNNVVYLRDFSLISTAFSTQPIPH